MQVTGYFPLWLPGKSGQLCKIRANSTCSHSHLCQESLPIKRGECFTPSPKGQDQHRHPYDYGVGRFAKHFSVIKKSITPVINPTLRKPLLTKQPQLLLSSNAEPHSAPAHPSYATYRPSSQPCSFPSRHSRKLSRDLGESASSKLSHLASK